MKNIFLFAIAFIAFSACTKHDQTKGECNKPFCNYTTIIVGMEHHGKVIDNGSVFIKKGVSDKPEQYDAGAKIEIDGKFAVAKFPQLEPGVYYVYAQGFDNDIQQVVSGGKPITIQWGYEFIEYRTTVAVTESDHGIGGAN